MQLEAKETVILILLLFKRLIFFSSWIFVLIFILRYCITIWDFWCPLKFYTWGDASLSPSLAPRQAKTKWKRGTRMGLPQEPRKYARALCTGWIQTLPSTQLEHELHLFLPFMLESSTIDSSPVWLFELMLIHITNVEGGGGSPSCTSEAALWGLIGCSMGKTWGRMQCPVQTRHRVICSSFTHSTLLSTYYLVLWVSGM